MSEQIEVLLVPTAGTPEQNTVAAQDLAWEHASTLASMCGFEIGSEEFLNLHSKLLTRYANLMESYGFMQNFGLRLLREMLQTQHVALITPLGAGPEEASDTVQKLTQLIVGGVFALIVSEDMSWVSNTDWESLDDESRGITFSFTSSYKEES